MSGYFLPPRHWWVVCMAAKRPFCDFKGYRVADSREAAAEKPCPRCGDRVQVLR